jgi:holo-[acyl-carrier protein] synthase
MILGIGTDLFDVDRMRRKLESDAGFVESVFLPAEIAYCRSQRHPAPHFAARFAAKEAIVKAMADAGGTGSFWLDAEVVREDSGKPRLELTGSLGDLARDMGIFRISLSLTHTDELAAATVVIEGPPAAPDLDPDSRRQR